MHSTRTPAFSHFHVLKAEVRTWGHRMVFPSFILNAGFSPLGPRTLPPPLFFLPKERQYGNQSQQLPGYIGGLLKWSGPNCSEMPKEGNTKLVGTLWALLKNRSFKFQGYMLSQPLNSSQGQGSRIKISDV